jgi:hypothetical protein
VPPNSILPVCVCLRPLKDLKDRSSSYRYFWSRQISLNRECLDQQANFMHHGKPLNRARATRSCHTRTSRSCHTKRNPVGSTSQPQCHRWRLVRLFCVLLDIGGDVGADHRKGRRDADMTLHLLGSASSLLLVQKCWRFCLPHGPIPRTLGNDIVCRVRSEDKNGFVHSTAYDLRSSLDTL